MKKKSTALILLLAGTPLALAQEPITEEVDDAEPELFEQTVPVADDAVADEGQEAAAADATTPDLADEEVTEARLFEEFDRYRALVREGTLDEADVVAKRIVEMAIRIYGPRSRETASALNNLAIVQHSNGQYDAAIQNFTQAVEVLEIVEDRLNNALVNPLRGLGAAQLANGRPDRANRTFERAAHITRVNDGPHNIEQVEVLESIAETHMRMGDMKSARNVLDRIHALNVRFFEKDPLGLIPSLMNRASWQHRAGYYNEERASYRRAIRIVEAGGDKNSPLLIEPLRRLGESFYFVDVTLQNQQQGMVSTGEVYFKRAVRIAERTEDLPWQELVDTKLALGDFYTVTDAQNRARREYGEVWEFLSTDEERIAYRKAMFSDPVPVREEPLPNMAGGGGGRALAPDEILTGQVTVKYSVSTRGRVRINEIVTQPAEFSDMERLVHREVRRRVYRPRIVDAKLMQADDLVLTHEFSYMQEDLDALREAQRATGTAADTQSR